LDEDNENLNIHRPSKKASLTVEDPDIMKKKKYFIFLLVDAVKNYLIEPKFSGHI